MSIEPTDWIDAAAADAASSTACCDISSSSAYAIANVIRRHVPAQFDLRQMGEALEASTAERHRLQWFRTFSDDTLLRLAESHAYVQNDKRIYTFDESELLSLLRRVLML